MMITLRLEEFDDADYQGREVSNGAFYRHGGLSAKQSRFIALLSIPV